jgi:hypothetical protein
MAMPRKGRRALQVAEDKFFWTTRRSEDGATVLLHVEHAEVPTAKIQATFHVRAGEEPLAVTPDVARQVVERVFRTGWNPWAAKKTVTLDHAEEFVTVAPDAVGESSRFAPAEGE